MVPVDPGRPQLDLNMMICVLRVGVYGSVSQFLLFLLFLNKQAGQSIRLWRYLTSNKNINMTNFIQLLNIPLLKTKKPKTFQLYSHAGITHKQNMEPPSGTAEQHVPLGCIGNAVRFAYELRLEGR